MNNILLRSISGAIYILILLVGVLFYSQITIVVYGTLLTIGLVEYRNLMAHGGNKLKAFPFVSIGLIIYILMSLIALNFISIVWVSVLPVILLVFLIASLFDASKASLYNTLIGVGGYAYILVPLILFNYLFFFNEDGQVYYFWPVVGMMILTWTSDVFAFLFGKFFGKRKLFERISPKKTWEGVIGGLAFAVLAAAVINYFDTNADSTFWIPLGFMVPLFAILGDLFESLIKRTVGVKDSGTIIPGHGGVLDRIDAMLFTVPLTFSWLYLHSVIFA